MADCNGWDPTTWGNCASNVVGDAVNNGVVQFAKAMMEGYDQVLKTFITSWLGQGVLVDLNGPSVAWFQTSITFINIFLVTIGLMIAAIRTAFAAKGEPLTTAFKAVGTVFFITFAGTLGVQVLLLAGNAFSKWILDAAGVSSTGFAVAVGFYLAFPGLGIIFGLFGILATAFQWGIMFLRGAVLPLLSAFWPTAASMAIFKGHEGAFKKITTWILAFIVYSPLAACIYALAWRMKSGDDGVGGVINGLILIVLAVLTLPALLRLMAPVAEVLGRAAGGAMAMGVTAAAVGAGVAVGAAVATGGASAGASAGGSAGGGSAGAGVAKGGGSAADTGGAGKEATGSGGSSDSSKGGGSDAAGSAVGGDGPTEAGQSSGGPAASGGESGGSSSGTPAASGGESGGSGAGWKAAQGVTESGGESGDNTAEGMIGE